MSKLRKKYSAEYKCEAVALALQSDTSNTDVARSLGISSGNRWIKECETPEMKAFPGNGIPKKRNS